MKKAIITLLSFLMFTAVIYLGYTRPIIGTPTDNNYIMNITVITGTETYHAIVYNTVHNGTTTYIETAWRDTNTYVYTVTFVKPRTTTTSISVLQPTTTTETRTESSTVQVITKTTYITHTQKITVVPPEKTTNYYMTSKIVEIGWRSAVVWASISYPDKIIIGYTTFFYS